MINKVIEEGRLAKDVEIKRTSSGMAVCNFVLAVERIHIQSDGKKVDYFDCVCWNKLAENLEKYCKKGSPISIVGTLQTRSYENSQGVNVKITEIKCDEIHFLSSRTANKDGSKFKQEESDSVKEFEKTKDSFELMDDDIQF